MILMQLILITLQIFQIFFLNKMSKEKTQLIYGSYGEQKKLTSEDMVAILFISITLFITLNAMISLIAGLTSGMITHQINIKFVKKKK